jgi:hypothetical protein
MAHAIKAANLSAQLHHRGAGNPVSVLPRTAISNCFPGLEFDFRALWRRTFEGIVLLECNNYVVEAEDPRYDDLVGRRLLRVECFDTMVLAQGPALPGGTVGPLGTQQNPNAVSFMEWSNSLARILHKQGQEVDCEFTEQRPAVDEVITAKVKTIRRRLRMRCFFELDSVTLSSELLQPGDLTQGLCSPWQNDYRECACYYWAASRPDYVNVQQGADGLSHGDMWMQKTRTGSYVPDDRKDKRLVSYDELFRDWQGMLTFIICGKDASES